MATAMASTAGSTHRRNDPATRVAHAPHPVDRTFTTDASFTMNPTAFARVVRWVSGKTTALITMQDASGASLDAADNLPREGPRQAALGNLRDVVPSMKSGLHK